MKSFWSRGVIARQPAHPFDWQWKRMRQNAFRFYPVNVWVQILGVFLELRDQLI
jgi:hypothetical protein